ncbi:MAG: Glutamate 5-kinase [Candidatus Nomurabacteria bacterium GW2011_GWA2_43_15]|uniref:Glutamate 5-kinase n=2 Tax=Candidatus Nomuraibacteriota TaxID=1752729 RepID=A0A0G1DRS2_9BACT|nr:MAG: Glutamate 5-kinase [Candidatus Nomurabacteria bacterium GW2011_GWA2_43_15]KKT19516.1 MAG: Glutamate 5-kinase [Candidatus Nomurabacteria bacterium GW2011_GWB1_43_7]
MRFVIKIGTQSISGKSGLNKGRIRQIVAEIAALFKLGHEVVLVSSGAIGAGLPLVQFKSPLRKKIAAAVGQPILMQSYIHEARKRRIVAGQILILSDDFTNRKHFKNFVLNMEAMLSHKILPIINENDVMKREDLRVNDNDMLSAMVAVGLRADKLIILTNQDGLYTKNPDIDKNSELIKNVTKIDSKIKSLCFSKSDLGVGGMLAKVKAAEYATQKGVETLIGNGERRGIMVGALRRNFYGTRFMAKKI